MWDPDRAAEGAAEIVLSKRWFWYILIIVEPIIAVEHVIPQVVIGGAMELIGARLSLEGKLAARAAPIFGRIGRTLYAKFLQIIHRDQGLGSSQGRRSADRAARA